MNAAHPQPHPFGAITAVIVAAVLAGVIHPSLAPGAAPSTPQLLDRVVALVNNQPILESDITLARLCKLVPGLDDLPPAKQRPKLVEARVRLELQYQDLVASGAIYRLSFDSGPTYRHLLERAGIPAAKTAAAARRLAASGLRLEDIRDLAIRIAAVNAYVEQRLRPQVRVTLPELRLAYQQTLALEITARGASPPPFSAVRSQLERVLVERKLNKLIESWIVQSRSRLDVTLLAP